MIVFGKNVAKEVIANKVKINKVFLTKTFDDRGILDFLEKNNIRRVIIDKKEMDLKYNGNHQGIVLDIEDFKYTNIDEVLDKDFVLLLDHLEDPHNFGAIIRTAEAAGVDAIIIPKNRSVEVNSTVMKVSAGALNNSTIVEVSNLVNTIEMTNSEVYTDVKYDSKVALVIGAEGPGISKLVREKCDFVVNIPMVGKINSLNASVAAGIIIYEVVRQKSRS